MCEEVGKSCHSRARGNPSSLSRQAFLDSGLIGGQARVHGDDKPWEGFLVLVFVGLTSRRMLLVLLTSGRFWFPAFAGMTGICTLSSVEAY